MYEKLNLCMSNFRCILKCQFFFPLSGLFTGVSENANVSQSNVSTIEEGGGGEREFGGLVKAHIFHKVCVSTNSVGRDGEWVRRESAGIFT